MNPATVSAFKAWQSVEKHVEHDFIVLIPKKTGTLETYPTFFGGL